MENDSPDACSPRVKGRGRMQGGELAATPRLEWSASRDGPTLVLGINHAMGSRRLRSRGLHWRRKAGLVVLAKGVQPRPCSSDYRVQSGYWWGPVLGVEKEALSRLDQVRAVSCAVRRYVRSHRARNRKKCQTVIQLPIHRVPSTSERARWVPWKVVTRRTVCARLSIAAAEIYPPRFVRRNY